MNIIFNQVPNLEAIKKGDRLLIAGRFATGEPIQLHKVADVKVSTTDGVEIILNRRKNIYFNLGMYLTGASWVKQVYIVKHFDPNK